MSNYLAETLHPVTGKIEQAEWLDDYFGRHLYGVRFPSDGKVYKASLCGKVDAEDLMEKLPNRLRLIGDWSNHEAGLKSPTVMHLAANYIETLERERASWKSAHDGVVQTMAKRIEALEAALRPFADKYLYPDDTGAADEIRADEDWDEEQNDKTVEEYFIERGWVRAARIALGGGKD